ncbi:MAG: hypothetical protein IKA05_08665 [Clostridia bacterium]|nr:hypothetical protein [Clostridia bacterium]
MIATKDSAREINHNQSNCNRHKDSTAASKHATVKNANGNWKRVANFRCKRLEAI